MRLNQESARLVADLTHARERLALTGTRRSGARTSRNLRVRGQCFLMKIRLAKHHKYARHRETAARGAARIPMMGWPGAKGEAQR